MPNPFFSGRIPKDLDERIKQYVTETGESKTDILINALAKYLDYPIKKPTSNLIASEERFRLIEERLEALEKYIKNEKAPIAVINYEDFVIKNKTEEPILTFSNVDKSDNCDNKTDDTTKNDNLDNISDNKNDKPESSEDLQLKDTLIDTKPDREKPDNNFDNEHNTEANTSESQGKNEENQQPETLAESNAKQPRFECLTSIEFAQVTGVPRRSLDDNRTKVRNKYRKLGRQIPEKQLLEAPEKIPFKKPFLLQDHPYELFFLGQDDMGNNLWSAYPSDNENYQQLSVANNSTANFESDSL